MATIPKLKTLTATSVDVLNAIRNSASQNYRDYVPVATPDSNSIKDIGAIIMQYPGLQNEFLTNLVNRIGRVIVTSKMYDNPWSMFKKGMLELGETVEEIFVNIASVQQYDPDAEISPFKREIPDVRAAFHVLNYKKVYPSTVVQENDLSQAFLSWGGVTDLIARITDSMYTAANYDEFMVMKYMLAKKITMGQMFPLTVSYSGITSDQATLTQDIAGIKSVSNKMTFLKTDYNLAGVYTHTLKDNQYIILTSDFEAAVGVKVLAFAFNMSEAEFMGHRVLVDGFGDLDIARLGQIFANDPNYIEFGEDELTALNAIPGIIVDIDYFQIYDAYNVMTEQYNARDRYWNYFLNVGRCFGVSPFANAVMMVPGAPTVTGVTVDPSTATLSKGASLHLSASVETTNFASQAVNWAITSGSPTDSGTYIDNSGNLHIGGKETVSSLTVTAKSVFDSTKSGQCVVTISE